MVDAPAAGPALLLDTCVYVDALEGSLPPEAERLLTSRTLVHLSIALGELAHNFGRLDPAHPGTARHLSTLAEVPNDIPPHRSEAVSASTMLEAGILAGTIYRLTGRGAGGEVAALNDAAIYLHAISRGYVVLTGNVRDFDFLDQILTTGRVLFYRPAP